MKLSVKSAVMGAAFLFAVGMGACAEYPSNTAHNELTEDGADKQDPDRPDVEECRTNENCPLGTLCKVVCREYADENGQVSEKCLSMCVNEDSDQACTCDEDCVVEGVAKGWCVAGQCIYDEPWECRQNQDCPEGFVCERYCDGSCDQNGDCTDHCYGKCVPQAELECRHDADCPADHVCQHIFPGAPDSWPPKGICVPAPHPTCRDNADCPFGFVCQSVCWSYIDNQGEFHEGCYTECIPDPSGFECRVDEDCVTAAGQRGFCKAGHCYFDEKFCLADDDCPPDFYCELMNSIFDRGVCMPRQDPGECRVDADCPDDLHCKLFWPCDNCEPVGRCVPNDPPHECKADSDCPPGFVCQMICAHCDANVPWCDSCYSECVPVDPPSECKTDDDCEPGFQCEMRCPQCSQGDPTCTDECIGMCVPVLPSECNDDEDCLTAAGNVGQCINGMCYFDHQCQTDQDCPPDHMCVHECWQCSDPNCQPQCHSICVPSEPQCDVNEDCLTADGRMGKCDDGKCIYPGSDHP